MTHVFLPIVWIHTHSLAYITSAHTHFHSHNEYAFILHIKRVQSFNMSIHSEITHSLSEFAHSLSEFTLIMDMNIYNTGAEVIKHSLQQHLLHSISVQIYMADKTHISNWKKLMTQINLTTQLCFERPRLRRIKIRHSCLQPPPKHGHTLQHTATHCNTLPSATAKTWTHTATHCSTLQQAAARCSTLRARQHAAAHCDIQQHTTFILIHAHLTRHIHCVVYCVLHCLVHPWMSIWVVLHDDGVASSAERVICTVMT